MIRSQEFGRAGFVMLSNTSASGLLLHHHGAATSTSNWPSITTSTTFLMIVARHMKDWTWLQWAQRFIKGKQQMWSSTLHAAVMDAHRSGVTRRWWWSWWSSCWSGTHFEKRRRRCTQLSETTKLKAINLCTQSRYRSYTFARGRGQTSRTRKYSCGVKSMCGNAHTARRLPRDKTALEVQSTQKLMTTLLVGIIFFSSLSNSKACSLSRVHSSDKTNLRSVDTGLPMKLPIVCHEYDQHRLYTVSS